MMELLAFAAARLKEPSTYVALATLATLLHVNLDPGLLQQVTFYGGIVAAVLGALAAESGKPAATVVTDLGAAVKAAMDALPKPPAPPAAAALALLIGLPMLGACDSASLQKAQAIAGTAITVTDDVVKAGTLFCSTVQSPAGQAATGIVRIAANAAGVPSSVIDQGAADVAQGCTDVARVAGVIAMFPASPPAAGTVVPVVPVVAPTVALPPTS